jgi:hypothetical protein
MGNALESCAGSCGYGRESESPDKVARKKEASRKLLRKLLVAAKLGITMNEIVFVSPGTDLLKKAYAEARRKGFKNIHLMEGTHIMTEKTILGTVDYVLFEVPMIVSGAGREKTFVEGGGFLLHGEKDQQCTFMDLTIQKTDRSGLVANGGMSFDCRRVRFDQCGQEGVYAYVFGNVKWSRSGRLTNCQVTNCGRSGIFSGDCTIEIEGEETRIDSNCTSGNSDDYGLKTDSSSSSIIHLLSPLTKKSISKKNKGGGNYGGRGTIKTVNSF